MLTSINNQVEKIQWNYKNKGMIHDVMLTGSFSRNILAMQIEIDNLVS